MDKYMEAFISAFEITEDEARKMKYLESEIWDSMGHMVLLSELEERFNIEFEPEEMIQIKSFDEGLEVLRKKGISIM